MTLHVLIIRYSFFAVLATLANLLAQRVVLSTGETVVHYIFAVGAGTLCGLVLKYILDKKWIFYDETTDLKQNGWQFVFYTGMGVVTTAIFWATETAFWIFFGTDQMRELGAILGLSVGYIVKYQLDRRYVFTDAKLHVGQCT